MPVFEQDWLELGSRVARSLHYQARRWQREAEGGRHEAAGVDPLQRDDDCPSASEEAEQLELGRRVAQERGYQSALFDDPTDYA